MGQVINCDRTPLHSSHCPFRVEADMIIGQNFTLPDFQAKNFTPQKWVICEIVSQINGVPALNINIWAFFGYK